MRLTKIVCTLGPATTGVDTLCRMIEAGMDVARLNFSHGDHDSHRRNYEDVRTAAQRVGRPVGVLADISGPKLRLREVAGDGVDIRDDDMLILTTVDCVGTAERVAVNFSDLTDNVSVGESLFVDDGLIELRVESVAERDVHCRVVVGGTLKSRKGVNIPNVSRGMPALTPKDLKDIPFAHRLGVDFFALSFVRHPDDVREAQALVGDVPVIAKIEKPQAVEHLEAIANIADGCMVARGDLGIEVGQHKVPMLQKRIIRGMNERAKPVITATQMLESMVYSPQPTRAEVSDVANAVLDGSDALMLSAESAVGHYPVRAVQTMARIIDEVQATRDTVATFRPDLSPGPPTVRNAVASSTAQAVIRLGIRVVAVYTDNGLGARLVAAHRPGAVICALCHDERLVPRMTLFWGVRPSCVERPANLDAALNTAERVVLDSGLARPGDDIAMAFTFEEDYDPRLTSGLMLLKLGAS